MTPEERAAGMVELVDRGGGYQSMRLAGQDHLLWHSADPALMGHRLAQTARVLAAVIRDAEARGREAEREACARIADGLPGHDEDGSSLKYADGAACWIRNQIRARA